MRRTIWTCTIVAVIVMPAVSVRGAEIKDAAAVVESLIASERKIRDVQARLTCYELGDKKKSIFFKWQWGYCGGREFFEGKMFTSKKIILLKPTTDGMTATEIEKESGGFELVKHAFDGSKQYIFRRPDGGDYSSGKVGAFDAVSFRGWPSPTELLGYVAKTYSRESLGEALSRAESLSIGESRIIDGRPCICIEGIGVDRCSVSNQVCDVRVWVDPERDYRPLRFEKCDSIAGKNRWKVPTMILDNIELRKIDGVWFPVKGIRRHYKVTGFEFPQGMSDEERKALSLKEIREQASFTLGTLCKDTELVVDVGTVAINKGIPDETFRVKFPRGCLVFDEFQKRSYKVGEASKEADEAPGFKEQELF